MSAFWHYVIVAIRKAESEFGAEVQRMARASELAEQKSHLIRLFNEMAERTFGAAPTPHKEAIATTVA